MKHYTVHLSQINASGKLKGTFGLTGLNQTFPVLRCNTTIRREPKASSTHRIHRDSPQHIMVHPTVPQSHQRLSQALKVLLKGFLKFTAHSPPSFTLSLRQHLKSSNSKSYKCLLITRFS